MPLPLSLLALLLPSPLFRRLPSFLPLLLAFTDALRTLAAMGAAESLDPAQRHKLVAALRSVAHGAGDAFVEALARRERQDRYEAAADQVWQRKLAGMFGETRDLQGAPEDT